MPTSYIDDVRQEVCKEATLEKTNKQKNTNKVFSYLTVAITNTILCSFLWYLRKTYTRTDYCGSVLFSFILLAYQAAVAF